MYRLMRFGVGLPKLRRVKGYGVEHDSNIAASFGTQIGERKETP